LTSYDKINASPGSLLRVWGAVERAARDEVVRVHGSLPKGAHGIAAVLRTWERDVIAAHPPVSLCPVLATTLRSQLQRPLDIRNGVCHGLIGISADTDRYRAALHWEINGKKQSMDWEDLQAMISWLSKLPRAFWIISNSSLGRLGSRATNNAENREWWLAEFALDLPEH
jgi:hypothetical protein